MTRRARILASLAVGAVLLLGGCVNLPEDGPVVESQASGSQSDTGAMFIDPRPPRPGASASEVVDGFLDAMTATPIQTNLAGQFLTRDAQASWNPELETITYADKSATEGSSRVLSVELSGANRLDRRGAWRGPLKPAAQTQTFTILKEDGEYRISDLPDALIVPESWFEQRFRQVSLYFFDPTAQVLVPEPVFVPRGEQLASTLIRGLLAGPAPELGRFSQTFVPAGLSAGLSVPVSSDGMAEIALNGEAGAMSPELTELMIAQLAQTLRQDPSIQRLRVTIGGQVVQMKGGITEFDVDQGEQYAPYVPQSSALLYGLDDARLVGGTPRDLQPAVGVMGHQDLGLRSLALDLSASRAAGVAEDGRSVLVGSVRDADAEVARPVRDATDLLEPAWDFAGRLWVVDRTPSGARVSYLPPGTPGPPRELDVPGVSGADVRHFLVSRDGSRLVAVVRRAGGDAVVVSRLLYDDQGVNRALPARQISDTAPGQRVKALAWRTTTSVVTVRRLRPGLFQALSATVDGAPSGPDGLSTIIQGDVQGLAGSPVPGQSLYAVLPGSLVDLSGTRGTNIEVDPALSYLGYVG